MLDKIKGLEPAAVAAAEKDKKGVAGWLKDLGGADAGGRARAAFRLAQLSAPGDDVAKKLAAQIKKEKDAEPKASELLALGAVVKKGGLAGYTDVIDRLTGDDDERSPKAPPVIVQLAAAIALAWAAPPMVTESMIARLEAHHKDQLPAAALPWNDGDIGGLIELCLPELRNPDLAVFFSTFEALMKAHPATPGPLGATWPMEVTVPWLRFAWRMTCSLGKRPQDEPLPSELSPEQRRVLVFATEHQLGINLADLGLDFHTPMRAERPSWRRYLGMDPAGPLDRAVSVGDRSLPIWKWLRLLTRKQIEEAPLREALAKALTPAEIVDLARDATFLFYAVPREDSFGGSPRSAFLLGLLDAAGAAVTAPDIEGIRHVLGALAKAGGNKLKAAGWSGGPFVSPG